VAADGTIDRPALAAVAFADEETRLELNAITHPAIGIAMIQARDDLADTDNIVVLAIPLLTALHRETVKLHKVVVVDCPTDIALERLLAHRGFDRADAEARIRAQITREERKKEADYVLDNSGDLAALEIEVAKLWDWLTSKRRPTHLGSDVVRRSPPGQVVLLAALAWATASFLARAMAPALGGFLGACHSQVPSLVRMRVQPP
jgi:dephospho-CoA kinase